MSRVQKMHNNVTEMITFANYSVGFLPAKSFHLAKNSKHNRKPIVFR